MKRILTLVLVTMLILSSLADAAVSKPTMRPSAPKSGTVLSPAKPAAPAAGYGDKGAGSQAKPERQEKSEAVDSYWHHVGWLGGSMVLGIALSNMFGFGHVGFIGPLLGIIINLLMLVVLFLAVRFVWQKVNQPRGYYY